VFDTYDKPRGARTAPLAPGAYDWSGYNKPIGEMRTADPQSWSNWLVSKGQDALIGMGMDPYRAKHMSEGLTGVARINPLVNAGVSAADLTYDLPRGNLVNSALDVLGVAPGALNASRYIHGVPKMPMADTPTGVNEARSADYLRRAAALPERENMIPGLPRYPRMGTGAATGAEDELLSAGRAAYGRTRSNPALYHPQSMNEYIAQTMHDLSLPHGPNNTTHIPENSPEFYQLMERWYNRGQQYAQRGQPITAEIWDQFRQELNSLQGHSGTAGSKAANAIDHYMVNPPQGRLVSGTQADLNALRTDFADARGNWRSGKTAQTIENDLIRRQSAARVHGTDVGDASKESLNQFANTEAGASSIWGATPGEREAIRGAAEGSPTVAGVKHMGSILGSPWTAALGSSSAGTLSHVLGMDPVTTAIAGGAGMTLPKVASMPLQSIARNAAVRDAEEAIANIRRNSPLYRQRSAEPPEGDYSPGRPVPAQAVPGQKLLPPPPSTEIAPELPPIAAQGGWTPPATPPQRIPYAPPPGTPPIDNPSSQLRDAVAYALLPQVEQKGKDAWAGAYAPYERKGADLLAPGIPRVIIDQPAESWDPRLEQ
jgi:hypothetical protein